MVPQSSYPVLHSESEQQFHLMHFKAPLSEPQATVPSAIAAISGNANSFDFLFILFLPIII